MLYNWRRVGRSDLLRHLWVTTAANPYMMAHHQEIDNDDADHEENLQQLMHQTLIISHVKINLGHPKWCRICSILILETDSEFAVNLATYFLVIVLVKLIVVLAAGRRCLWLNWRPRKIGNRNSIIIAIWVGCSFFQFLYLLVWFGYLLCFIHRFCFRDILPICHLTGFCAVWCWGFFSRARWVCVAFGP